MLILFAKLRPKKLRPFFTSGFFWIHLVQDGFTMHTYYLHYYCPLIWMHGCKSNDGAINKVHKRALCAIYKDFQSNLQTLLDKDKSVNIHVRNLRTLLIEVFKSISRINPEFMWNVFEENPILYNLRSKNLLKLPPTRTIKYGINSLAFRGSILWNSLHLPSSLKSTKSVSEFKHKIKIWNGDSCSCPLCS